MNEENVRILVSVLPIEILNTIYMVGVSALIALLIGLPIGVILMITDREGICHRPFLYRALEVIVNITRSFPFAIFMVALIPFTRWVIGTSLGTTASIVPLSLAAAPFIARLVEVSLKEVDPKLIEAAKVMGSTNWQIVRKVLLPESLSSLIHAITLTLITLIGYSAMAGLIGGGGLGKVAFQYGYNRFNPFIMFITIVHIVILVQLIQWYGDRLAKNIRKKRGLEK